MKNLDGLFSAVAKKVVPYQWEEGISDQMLRFDTNTFPYPPRAVSSFLKIMKKKCLVNEYTDPSYTKLKKLIADYEGVTTDMITVTNSGDEAIDVVTKTFLNPGDSFIVQPPTFEMFKIQGEINKGKAIEVPLSQNGFDTNVEEILLREKGNNAKIIFICNPNNPTGTVVSPEKIEKVIRESRSIVLVDEVYREFYGQSVVPLLPKYPNLVVLRSFSKFAGMAGARIGYLIASPEISKLFDGIRLPMAVSYFSTLLAELVLEKDRKWIKEQVAMIVSERKRITKLFTDFGFYVYPSQTNFLLVKIGDRAKEICEKLKGKNILVRDRSKKKYLEGCVRITVRNPEQNTILIKSLKEFL